MGLAFFSGHFPLISNNCPSKLSNLFQNDVLNLNWKHPTPKVRIKRKKNIPPIQELGHYQDNFIIGLFLLQCEILHSSLLVSQAAARRRKEEWYIHYPPNRFKQTQMKAKVLWIYHWVTSCLSSHSLVLLLWYSWFRGIGEENKGDLINLFDKVGNNNN